MTTTPPRLADVAAAAKVSSSTASRVLSGSDRVSEELRGRVLAAARELNFVPNVHAQALASADTTTVGLVVHDVSDPYFSEIAQGVLRVASENQRMVLISTSHRDPERELSHIQTLRAHRVSAIVLAGSGFLDSGDTERVAAELQAFEATGGRVAMIGRHRLPVDAVLPDNRGGAQELGRYLLGLRHREIGVITGPATLTTVEDRLAGFREALAENGVELPAARIADGDFTRDGGFEAAHELFDANEGLTAVFALNDAMAIGAMAALRSRGIAVPDEVSVAGFDDIPMVVDVTPPLTTVRLDMQALGATAMGLALRKPTARPRRRRMQPSLIVRESTQRLT